MTTEEDDLRDAEDAAFSLVVDNCSATVDQLIRFMSLCPYRNTRERVAALTGFMETMGYSGDLNRVLAAVAINRLSGVKYDVRR